MSDEDIKSYADCIENNRDPFSCWAYNHILNSLNEWNDVMYELSTSSCYNDDLYHEVGVNLDYYWLLECRNEQEVLALLQSWYKKLLRFCRTF